MDIVQDVVTAQHIEVSHLLRVTVRLVVATFLGALVGFQQARSGTAVGLRVHMRVSQGAALLVIVLTGVGTPIRDMVWIIQGLVVGMSIVAGGVMLKISAEGTIEALPAAAGIWMTAAIGVAVGLGRLWTALLGVVLGCIMLALIDIVEQHSVKRRAKASDRMQY